MHLNEQLYCFSPRLPTINNIFRSNTEKSNFVFHNSCDHTLDCYVFSSQKSQEIPSPEISLPKLARRIWYEIAWAWSSRPLSRELQKYLYCWYLLPKQCSFGITNPNFLMSVSDFSDLTQSLWQVATGKDKQNHFLGDTICKQQVHSEIKFLATRCFHILRSREPRQPTPVEEKTLKS